MWRVTGVVVARALVRAPTAGEAMKRAATFTETEPAEQSEGLVDDPVWVTDAPPALAVSACRVLGERVTPVPIGGGPSDCGAVTGDEARRALGERVTDDG